VLPSAETAAMLFWALLTSGQTSLRKVDGWQSLGQPLADSANDLAARGGTVITPEALLPISNTLAIVPIMARPPALPPRFMKRSREPDTQAHFRVRTQPGNQPITVKLGT
jgi:hypothetical protein